jgi:hypothetical protein
MKWFNWRIILQTHVYLGLFCLPYLLIFAISSLNFNHHFLAEDWLSEAVVAEIYLEIPILEDNKEMANALIDSLDQYGWYFPWDTRRDSVQFVTGVGQPGRKLSIIHQWESGQTTIRTQRKSVGGLFKTLHFLGGEIPYAPWWINLWQYHQALTAYAMLFWVGSGVYLWLRKAKSPRIESYTLWGFAIFSILLLIYLWLLG